MELPDENAKLKEKLDNMPEVRVNRRIVTSKKSGKRFLVVERIETHWIAENLFKKMLEDDTAKKNSDSQSPEAKRETPTWP